MTSKDRATNLTYRRVFPLSGPWVLAIIVGPLVEWGHPAGRSVDVCGVRTRAVLGRGSHHSRDV